MVIARRGKVIQRQVRLMRLQVDATVRGLLIPSGLLGERASISDVEALVDGEAVDLWPDEMESIRLHLLEKALQDEPGDEQQDHFLEIERLWNQAGNRARLAAIRLSALRLEGASALVVSHAEKDVRDAEVSVAALARALDLMRNNP